MRQGNLFTDLPPPGEKPIKMKRASHPVWTENKAKFIERYLRYFVLVTKHGAYIDGFAGPQADEAPDSWTAKLVLESKPPFLRDFWLCDANSKAVAALNDLLALQPRIRGRHIEVVPGDFNRNVSAILASGRIKEKVATFCLLDQRTFECEWDTLRVLADHKQLPHYKIELFYFLASGWLDRAIAATKNTNVIDRWWGRDDWPDLRKMSSFQRAQAFSERFKAELGYKHAYAWEIYSRETKGRIMYHMIHATDHDAAPLLMNRAYRMANSKREELKRLQMSLEELWRTTGPPD
jgi:three-Cys-motif partner protein